jgi:hypothetical protein
MLSRSSVMMYATIGESQYSDFSDISSHHRKEQFNRQLRCLSTLLEGLKMMSWLHSCERSSNDTDLHDKGDTG